MRGVHLPDGVARLNRALAILALTLEAEGGDLPELDAMVLTPQYVELHLPGPRVPVAPFVTDPSRPNVWLCCADSPALLPGQAPDPPRSAYPALVSVGWERQGHTVLIDLERAGVLNPTGDPACTRHLFQALATELAARLFSSYLPASLTGQTAAEPTTVFDAIHVTTAEAAAAQLREHAAWQRTILDEIGADSPRACSNWTTPSSRTRSRCSLSGTEPAACRRTERTRHPAARPTRAHGPAAPRAVPDGHGW